jgi:hypothetical protein
MVVGLAFKKDTKGLKCPTLSPQDQYDVPEGARVLNYTLSQAMTSILSVKDKNNPTILP